jgi:hypothetical protein
MRLATYAFLFSVWLLAVGCDSPIVDMTKTSKGIERPTDPNAVEILVTKPNRPFTELATVASSGWAVGDTAKMHNSLRAKAATLGADAVLITNTGMTRNPNWGNMEMWCAGVAIHY